jgi:isoleucyl-tRNA synthetase
VSQDKVQKYYPEVNSQPNYPKIEEQALARWQENKTFDATLNASRKSDHSNDYVFYDGPPFANGSPHYGHLLTGFVKDIVPRYQTMRGKFVDRRFGWDCHGLPAEMEVEKQLKISGRKAITEYGIDKFNNTCRESVLTYTNEWRSTVTRQARWVDFDRDYKTMDSSYMESVIWAFKQLWEKGLIYKGYKVMPYSWACQTPLSNFETKMDNSYRERQDPAVTVAFNLWPLPEDPMPIRVLAWTTTPWTLPSNFGLAVNQELEYLLVEDQGQAYVLAAGVFEKLKSVFKEPKTLKTIQGNTLVGRKYEPLFPYFSKTEGAFKVFHADFVTTDEGTGVVHLAPYGEDDFKLFEQHGVELTIAVDDAGVFTEPVSDYLGQHVFDANKNIIKDLKQRGQILKHETYLHNYPHCWRTDTPVIYKPLSSWFVKVTDIKDRMIELNHQIRWIPEHVKYGQWGTWLENARDWSISRNRFWGTPIPVWESDDPRYPRVDVYGSIAELERDFGVKVTDLHRPFIDELVRPNPDDPTGKSMMRRVSEVFDCWFESGSMPFAQIHYPFENKEWFENNFPADFIVEYIAQTRGWFYTLMVLGTALFDRPPFLNCICHGVVLDVNGQKLSKRLRNYPSPEEVFSKFGADALRWFLCQSQVLRGSDIQIDTDGKEIGKVQRAVHNPLWNAFYFFTLYANTDGIKAEYRVDSKELLDRYILSKMAELISAVENALDNYDIPEGCARVVDFLDVLTNWYIRRSREVFWKSGVDAAKTAAFNTLYSVLCDLCRVVAPLLPMVADEIFRGLTGKESVHLESWPSAATYSCDEALVANMDRVRQICSAALAIREAKSLRTRLPLAELTVVGADVEGLAPYSAIIADEINIKSVNFSEEVGKYANYQLKINARALGPRLGSKVQQIIAAAKGGNWKLGSDGSVSVAEDALLEGEYELSLVAREGFASQNTADRSAVVILDVRLTPELEAEGAARDLIRAVQQTRKEADLHVADRIKLAVEASTNLVDQVRPFADFIKEQTLAIDLDFGAVNPNAYAAEADVAGERVKVSVLRN